MIQGIKNKDILRFEKTAKKLASIMEEIQEYNPNAFMYCNMDNLELFGDENDGDIGKTEPVASVYVPKTDCGER